MLKDLGAIQRSILIVLARRPTPLEAGVLRAAVKRLLEKAPSVNWRRLFGGLQERGLIHVDKDDSVSITEKGRIMIKLSQMHE